MNHRVVCIGAMLVDELFYCSTAVVAGSSNPAKLKRSAGGVMRNIAHHLSLLEIPVQFLTVAGNDADGKWLIDNCLQAGINISEILHANCSSGKYAAILQPDGNLFCAAAVNPAENYLTIDYLESKSSILLTATIVVADTNLNAAVLEWLMNFCYSNNKLLIIEPVSVEKARKLCHMNFRGVFMVTPNTDELLSLSHTYTSKEQICNELFEKGVRQIWLRKGDVGSEMMTPNGSFSLHAPHVSVKDITGAGDAALAAWIACFAMGMSDHYCMLAAHSLAAEIITISGAVDIKMNKMKLFEHIKKYYPNEI